jgi:hypothetical protein
VPGDVLRLAAKRLEMDLERRWAAGGELGCEEGVKKGLRGDPILLYFPGLCEVTVKRGQAQLNSNRPCVEAEE